MGLLKTLAATAAMLAALSGCVGDVVIVQPGEPVEIAQQCKVKVRSITDGGIGKAEIGGYLAVPRHVWEMLLFRLHQAQMMRNTFTLPPETTSD